MNKREREMIKVNKNWQAHLEKNKLLILMMDDVNKYFLEVMQIKNVWRSDKHQVLYVNATDIFHEKWQFVGSSNDIWREIYQKEIRTKKGKRIFRLDKSKEIQYIFGSFDWDAYI